MRAKPTTVLTPALALGAAALFGAAMPFGAATVLAAPPAQEAPGAVAGRVELEVSGESRPPMLSPYSRRRYRPPTPSPATPGSPENVVVYVLPGDGAAVPARDTSVAIAQRDRTIIPHVTAVPVGTRIEFPNEDEVFHNLFSLSDAREFNLGRYPPGESRSETFPEAGVVRMFCDIHSEMGGVIVVVETPWVARPDADGRYRIAGVAPGRHRLVAWHETAGADTIEVVVRPGATTTTDLRLPR